ncbi:hypothetical protein [Methylocystis iwaonis]|uniref:hypothetical protein n=1 Tax=Methylocystis iwaonis TaxID=2885079 RepID=UPI002E7C32C4|nr:hypothetical protein [Methylocystis iwaonis]
MAVFHRRPLKDRYKVDGRAALHDVHPRAAFQRWAQNPQVLNKVRGSPIRRRTPIPGPPPTGETTTTSF